MKYTVFNKLNASQNRHGNEAQISFLKSGKIYINNKAMALTGIDKTNRCEIVLSENGDWYITADGDINSFIVKRVYKGGIFNCEFIARKLRKDDKTSLIYRISGKPVKEDLKNLYLILTNMPKLTIPRYAERKE